jgi:pyruvate-ferredoxin/flavodoxin oxidoreductase
MGHVCGGVIGYPITPSTEISEIYEAFRADGGINVWGKHPFFFEPEGEHSAQSGALGAALTGGQYISNATSSQGVLYGLESHYVTVGKKVGGFVLQVAARVVSKHSLNVMAGHDDVYALLSSGYTILFGANPQEAADLAAISYRVASLSLIPVTNAMDGFATSHMLSEARLPEPELLAEYLGDPAGRIPSPTVAQEILFGAKGRVFQLKQYLSRHQADITEKQLAQLLAWLDAHAAEVEKDNAGAQIAETLAFLPEELHGQWRRQWLNAFEKGSRQRVPALVDIHNPGLTGPVQNQPDFQAGAADHRTHFASEVPRFVRQAMDEYAQLTGRRYAPVQTFQCDDAETVMVGLGSVTDDAEAVVTHLRGQGKKVGLVAIKLLQPFPEAELVAALAGKKAVTVLERSEQTALTSFVTQALFKARENAQGARHAGIPAIDALPKLTTAIFGLGGHDLQPRHLIAAFKNMESGQNAPFIYLGSQFFSKDPSPSMAALQARLRAAYPETELMALDTETNPNLLPKGAFRVRFHSVGGYGTMATGKLLTDILSGVLDMRSKSAPKYGSEKSGAPTNYYITLSPEPIKITNAELEDVEIVVSPDHKVFSHTNPLRGLAAGGTFILQSSLSPEEVWRELPAQARKTLREKKIQFFIVDAFAVAKKHAPTPDLLTRMMGIAFIGAVAGHVERVTAGASADVVLSKVRQQIAKKFGGKGEAVVEANVAVIREGMESTHRVDYSALAFTRIETQPVAINVRGVALSAMTCGGAGASPCGGFCDTEYYDDVVARHFREGTIAEAPVLPGTGLFMPTGTAAWKDKGLFRRTVPMFNPELCTGCVECALVCPDAAIPNAVHEIHDLIQTAIRQFDIPEAQREAMRGQVHALSEAVRNSYRQNKEPRPLHEIVAEAITHMDIDNATLRRNLGQLAEALAVYPVAKTRPFFDAMEKATPGSGGLYAVAIDPWKCTGCLECLAVCGPGALEAREQDTALFETLQGRFEFFGKTPNTPARFLDGATLPEGETKRVMLDRPSYYAVTGGHGACSGCGEVTAIRQVMAVNRSIHDQRRRERIREVEGLIESLRARQSAADGARSARIDHAITTLEKWLYLYESGPSGNGPSSAVIANSTGCSTVYASTFPFNPYNDPWVNSLFQDAQPLAKGLFEGLAGGAIEGVRALRTAQLELEDAYDEKVHDQALRLLSWQDFTVEELSLLPTVLTIGGDGASYDIGFGALSRILASRTPIKMLVLNTGVYSNTGGQASTASFYGQDSDLSRHGSTHSGKYEQRKELGLIAAFHPGVLVIQGSTALGGHYLKNTLEFLGYTDGPALLDVYTPCQPEHGIADDAANRQARLAVDSRMIPVFVHDPRRGKTLYERFSLEGNPDLDKTWSKMAIEYVDAEGRVQLLEVPLTPAHFALSEGRFKKHFRKLAAEADAVPVEEYIDLSEVDREGKTPFIWTTDAQRRLLKLGVAPTIVALVQERRGYWRMLQSLAGQPVAEVETGLKARLSALQAEYDQALKQSESSLDEIASGMAELAALSKAPVGRGTVIPIFPAGAKAPAAKAAPDTGAAAGGEAVSITDQAKCTDCKTCYQDIPELFEKTRIVVDGATKDVARVIPGVLERAPMTPQLMERVKRAASACDAEIIHCAA